MPQENDTDKLIRNSYPRPSFCAFLNKFGDKELVCAEIGVDEGLNAKCMLDSTTKAKFILVDPYKPYEDSLITQSELNTRKQKMLDNISKFNGRVKYFENESVDVAKMFPNEYFDYVYIDGSHKYHNVRADIEAWYPKIKRGGIFAGHDYFLNDVHQAIEEILIDRENLFVWGVEVHMRRGNLSPGTSLPYRDCIDWWVHREEWIMTPIAEVKVG